MGDSGGFPKSGRRQVIFTSTREALGARRRIANIAPMGQAAAGSGAQSTQTHPAPE